MHKDTTDHHIRKKLMCFAVLVTILSLSLTGCQAEEEIAESIADSMTEYISDYIENIFEQIQELPNQTQDEHKEDELTVSDNREEIR